MTIKDIKAFRLLLVVALALATPLIAASCQKDPDPPVQDDPNWGPGGRSNSYSLNPQMSVAQITEGVQSRLDDAASGDTVIVAGSSHAQLDAPIVIDIPAGVTLEWAAACAVTEDVEAVLQLGGQGIFRLTDDGLVINPGMNGIASSETADGLQIIIDGGEVSGAKYGIIAEQGSADITIIDGIIDSPDAGLDVYNYAVGIFAGNLTINGGTFMASGTNARNVRITESAVAVINGGDFTVTDGNDSAAVVVNSASLTINGGDFTTYGDGAMSAIASFGSVVVIEDGNFIITAESGQALFATGESDITINGGQFECIGSGNCRALFIKENTSCYIYGGTFKAQGDERSCIRIEDRSMLSLRGGQVSSTGVKGIGITVIDSTLYMRGGTVTVTDAGGRGVTLDGERGFALIYGGKVSVPDTGYGIVHYGHGFAAYVPGTVTGHLSCGDGTDCAIIEVDAEEVPESRDGTSEGLTIIAHSFEGDHSVSWSMEDGRAYIVIAYGKGDPSRINWSKLNP